MKNYFKMIIYKIFRLLPIKSNKVLLFSYYGANYGGSPKYISQFLYENEKQFNLVWAFNDIKKYKSLLGVKKVKFSSFKYYYHLSTSRYIITNYRMTIDFKKKSKQIYIQTWHSSLRLKKIEKDACNDLSDDYIMMAQNDSKQINLLLAGCRKSREIFEASFWYHGEYLHCGTPQCDILMNQNNNLKQKVAEKLNFDKGKKVLMYAPTFRKQNDIEAYDLDYDKVLNTLNEKEDNWIMLIRLHPHLLNLVEKISFADHIIDATGYDDMQELLAITDIVITDYSALMFDFALTKKPCFLYMSDYNNYVHNERSFYFNIFELPFLISHTNNDLIKNIVNFDEIDYQKKLTKFLNEEIGTWELGNACKQVADYMKAI